METIFTHQNMKKEKFCAMTRSEWLKVFKNYVMLEATVFGSRNGQKRNINIAK